MTLHSQNELDQAEKLYRRELEAQPEFWPCRANLAQLLFEKAAFAAALEQARTALADCSLPAGQADILHLISRIFKALQQDKQALSCLEQALALTETALVHRDAARLSLRLGLSEKAGRHYRRALALNASETLQREAAEYFFSVQQFDSGISVLEKLMASQPAMLPPLKALLLGQIANARQELNQPQAALQAYDQALAADDRFSLRLARSLVLPVVYDDLDQVATWRTRLENELSDLVADQPADPLELGVLPFYAPYQGYDDRSLMESLARLYNSSLPEKPKHAGTMRNNKFRIGCVSHFFHAHSVFNCFEELLLELTAAPFELHGFSASPLIIDQRTQRLQQACASWTRLTGPLTDQMQAILNQELDLLLYTDMGLDAHTYLLAGQKLAPVQLLLPGQPVTSGLSSFDGFVSDRCSEPEQAQRHYTEKLIQLECLPTIYPMPKLPGGSRSRLGLPEGRLYLCPGQAFKFHPQMDEPLRQILITDPQARLLLMDLTPNGLIRDVARRLGKGLDALGRSRIVILPRLDALSFYELLQAVDVMLESSPFGNFNTLMAAFAVGMPVVTLPGAFLRGRYCLGLYRQMGIEGAVATDADDFTQLAIRIATDPARRNALSGQILAARPRIFDYRPAGLAFRNLLEELLSR